jgi:hypothetical protein
LTKLVLSEMQWSGFLALTWDVIAPLVTLLFFNEVLSAVVVHQLSFLIDGDVGVVSTIAAV